MESAFTKVDGNELVAIVLGLSGVISLVIFLVTAIVVPHWRGLRQTEAEMKLKQDMVAAGFNSEEIERVVRASSHTQAGQSKAERSASCRR